MADLVALDSLEIIAIIDNELDPISPCASTAIEQFGGLREIGPRGKLPSDDIRGTPFELQMSNICCSAHGLSLLIRGSKDGIEHTILLDTGPEAHSFERNASRLGVDLSKVETIQLSHWHRDHSGGMLKALEMIKTNRTGVVNVDLHPDRPAYRGAQPPGWPVVSLEPDPTFEELTNAGGSVCTSSQAHTVSEGFFLVSGEIPRTTSYERGLKFGVRFDEASKTWIKDEDMMDERILMCNVKDKGLVVFTGCAHAGVVNSAKYAIDLGSNVPLYAIMGGFHLADATPEDIEASVNDIAALNPQVLIPGHCTGWRAKFALQQKMPGKVTPCFVGSGFRL